VHLIYLTAEDRKSYTTDMRRVRRKRESLPKTIMVWSFFSFFFSGLLDRNDDVYKRALRYHVLFTKKGKNNLKNTRTKPLEVYIWYIYFEIYISLIVSITTYIRFEKKFNLWTVYE